MSFVSFHERGFGVPASRFMRAILHVYGVELHNLSPNSISQAAIFAAVCEGYLGIAPHWDLWTHLFSVELFASPMGERRVRMAVRASGCILQLRQARALQYIPAILASSNKGWQRRWFYLRNDDGRLPSFSQRVVTAAGPSTVLATTFEAEILPLALSSEAGADLADRGKKGAHGGAGRWLHPPAEAGVGAAVHSRHPRVFEQRVAAPVVLSPK